MRSPLPALVLLAGCVSYTPSATDLRRDSERYQRALRAESISVANSGDTIYQRRMADLVRRSLLVRTDSLARLTVALASGSVPERLAVREAMLCETYRLTRLHGFAAFSRAADRMSDSLRRTGFDAAATSDRALTIPGPPLHAGNQPCLRAADSLPELPDSLKRFIYRTPPPTR